MTGEIIRYEAMVYAIAECHAIDEVKDIRDKAMALELYAKQARNTDAERKASEIRLRAERRTGELLKDLARATPQTANQLGENQHSRTPASVAADQNTEVVAATSQPSPYRQAIDQAQIPERTAQRYQALANVPAQVFEEALRDPVVKPTTAALIRQARSPEPQMPADVLWLWGRLRDFERDGFFDKSGEKLLEPLTPSMRADIERIAPRMADFFIELNEAIHEFA
ncbi:MAG: hypothetical protein KBG00_10655 [Rhodoferax sp.]|jgi:hypothetical protein|uniref:hypothetical protein n=1 Tax=Rhodoferax sp. TaxID=50421 RepID=UPI001B3CEC01|nr:hypothetical protein [Rhodoferax sp.]MBP9149229.1 hypothetical protein [Rhodoferax sp.]MBP9736180.1 hypothetical protein [Rhodoferax sp.]